MKLHAYVSGRVQNVGFRFHVRARAEELRLDGWVKNLADGRVEVEVVGFEEELERFEELLREGPSAARVDDVRAERKQGQPDGSGFRVEFF